MSSSEALHPTVGPEEADTKGGDNKRDRTPKKGVSWPGLGWQGRAGLRRVPVPTARGK